MLPNFRGIRAIFACLIASLALAGQWSLTHARSKDDSLREYLSHFVDIRNHLDSSGNTNKVKARAYIESAFKAIGLQTWQESFQQGGPGNNVVGQLKGRFSGTQKDHVLVIGAHYDTVRGSPGVDDNGSGMAALLQAAKEYVEPEAEKCERNYTLMFVAFDRKECQALYCTDNDPRKCVCSHGSEAFVKKLTSSLGRTGGKLQGAIILDSVMNYDNRDNVQNITQGMESLMKDETKAIVDNQYRGDFLALVARKPDKDLIQNFTENAKKVLGRLKVRSLVFDIYQQPSSHPSLHYNQQIGQFYLSDHYRFWDHKPTSVPAIYLTDTAGLRGYMKHCWHQGCDSMNPQNITNDKWNFLRQVADTVALTARDMTQQNCSSNRSIAYIRREYVANSGEFTSPGYPYYPYPNNADCEWVITVSSGHDVALKFTEFRLEDNGCRSDYVEVRDGRNSQGKIIGKFCSSDDSVTKMKPLKSSGRYMFVKFISDRYETYKGFKATWTSPVSSSAKHLPWNLVCYLLAISLLTKSIM